MSKRLGDADRRLFTLVSRAAYENPFGEQRSLLDAAIADASPTQASSLPPLSPARDSESHRTPQLPDWRARMLARVGKRLSALSGPDPFDVRHFRGQERALVEDTVLFETFHRFLEPLDAFIGAQERAPDASLRVTFARDFLQGLVAHGVTPERAQRMLELFYQFRRAFYFISHGLVGDSDCMRKLRQQLWEAVFTRDIRRYESHLWNRMEDFSTILVGETGTGKGAAAAAIGLSGFIAFNPKTQAFVQHLRQGFVPIHLNEFPESLFESELFGHRKGAFTGAIDNYEGVLSRCQEHASVFLDEIGEATLPVQVKLLRVLQERVFTPVGGREPRRFAGRILAATHRSLPELRAQGAMRDDFFYRLCSNLIEVPPLRTRISQAPAELEQLVQHLCLRITGSEDRELTSEVTRTLDRDLGSGYAFPGNVRELEQCVRRVLLTGACVRDDRYKSPAQDGPTLLRLLGETHISAEQLLERYCAALYERHASFVEVARITGLDRRTVKKHIEARSARAEPT